MKKIWKIYKYTAVTLVTLFIIDLTVIFFFSIYRPEIKKSDEIVVLGAAINTPALYNRSLEGLRIYKQGKAPVIVVSGGVDYPKSISEAKYMQQVIEGNSYEGVPLILEDQSHNTYENIKNTRAKMPDAKSIIIVSDRFHLARAIILAKRFGFEDVYWSSPKPTYYKKSELAFYFFRESVAMVAYVPKFIFK